MMSTGAPTADNSPPNSASDPTPVPPSTANSHPSAPPNPANPNPTAMPDSITPNPAPPALVPNSSSAPAADAPAALPDAFSAISSMWSGWLTPTASASAATTERSADPTTVAPPDNAPPPDAMGTTTGATGPSTQEKDADGHSKAAAATAAAAAAAATDLFQGAGKMWNDMSASIKDAAENVDTGVINEQVTVFREKSGRLMEDVSRSVHSLNLSLQNTDLTKSAEAISSSTRDLLDKASQSIEQGRKEALEIFVDKGDAIAPPTNAREMTAAPWDASALPENERKYADTLRREMLKLVVDSIYSKKKRTALFLSDAAHKNGFQLDFAKNAHNAMAALDADTNMRRLRAGLVPGKMKEDVFWLTYFYHLHRIRQTLVANNGDMPESLGEEDDADEDALLFGDDGEAEELAALEGLPPAAGVETEVSGKADGSDGGAGTGVDSGDGERNWEEDIDAAFRDDEE